MTNFKQPSKLMCNLLTRFGSDVEAETNGRKFYIDKEFDIWILVSRFVARNSEVQKGIAQLQLKHGDKTNTDEYRNDTQENFIRCCIKGWNNICDENNVEIPFTQDIAVELLMQTPDLTDKLFDFALDGDNYRIEQAIKN